ncbi:MAG TPA: lytic murein transglycosylase [Candidatus Dormibacteraeota bacterium]|nr:lytic murein transglycosylase [Candidatus Dormibacteraeota bacterium]
MRLWVVAGWLLLVASVAGAVDRPFDPTWYRLQRRLIADGIDPLTVRAVFNDARMESFRGLAFSLDPTEHRSLYRGFLRADSLARARSCRLVHARALRGAELRYGVPAGVVGAIMHVESQCGRNTGRRRVLPQLAKLAMANDPENVRWNIDRHTDGVPARLRPVIEARVRARARELEQTFYPEVVATFRIAARSGIDPLAITGSGSGAFGLTQFLPSSYLRFGVDGDGDGRVSLYDADDAIASTANYLRGNGWRPGISHAEQRRVIWTYNHSDAYIDTVLRIADHVQ